MAANDDRRIPTLTSLGLVGVNGVIKRINEMVYQLEGRRGPINLRDSVNISALDAAPLSLLFGDQVFTEFSSESSNSMTNRTYFARGATFLNGQWKAKAQTATIVALTEVGILFYFNTGLTVGASYVPTRIYSIDTKGPPFCRLYKAADFSHNSSGNWVSFPFDSVDEDTDGMADIVNGKININTAGIYNLTMEGGGAGYTAVAGKQFALGARLNTSSGNPTIFSPNGILQSMQISPDPYGWGISDTLHTRLSKGDYLTAVAYQETGGAYTFFASSCAFVASWVRP